MTIKETMYEEHTIAYRNVLDEYEILDGILYDYGSSPARNFHTKAEIKQLQIVASSIRMAIEIAEQLMKIYKRESENDDHDTQP